MENLEETSSINIYNILEPLFGIFFGLLHKDAAQCFSIHQGFLAIFVLWRSGMGSVDFMGVLLISVSRWKICSFSGQVHNKICRTA